MPAVSPRVHVSANRPEPRDVVELRRLKAEHPELASAVDLQISLLDLQRRVESRVPLPTSLIQRDLNEALSEGRPLLRFRDLPIDWSDFRFALRETADLLLRFGVLEAGDHRCLTMLIREGHELEPRVERWFDEGRAEADSTRTATAFEEAPDQTLESLDQVLSLAIRPFLTRCAEAVLPRLDLSSWKRGLCPLCASEPEMAVIAARGGRWLICGRCRGRWPFDSVACPYCGNDDRLRLTSFASRDGRYRINACDVCCRYLKAYDERGADRPALVAVDTIATLPLDAAAMQRGYSS